MKLWSRSAVAALMMLPGAAGAVELGNAESGHDYARKVCAGCHAVEKGATISPTADVPSFQDVADRMGCLRALAAAAVVASQRRDLILRRTIWTTSSPTS
jgi:cytochrome c2